MVVMESVQIFNQDTGIAKCTVAIKENELPISKRYKCTYQGCSAAFGKPSRLVQHERVHSGDVCICNILFNIFHYDFYAEINPFLKIIATL